MKRGRGSTQAESSPSRGTRARLELKHAGLKSRTQRAVIDHLSMEDNYDAGPRELAAACASPPAEADAVGCSSDVNSATRKQRRRVRGPQPMPERVEKVTLQHVETGRQPVFAGRFVRAVCAAEMLGSRDLREAAPADSAADKP